MKFLIVASKMGKQFGFESPVRTEDDDDNFGAEREK